MDLPKSRIGKKTQTKTIDGKPMNYEVVDEEIFLAPSNNQKAFCLHNLRFDDGKEQIRISYYMIAEKPRMKGKWAFGQFAPMMTKEEISIMFEKAKSKGRIWLPYTLKIWTRTSAEKRGCRAFFRRFFQKTPHSSAFISVYTRPIPKCKVIRDKY